MGFLGGPWRAGGGQGEAVAGPKESVVEGCQRQMTHQKPRSTSLLLGPVQKHQTGAALQISFVEEPPGTGSVLGPAAEHPREPLMTGSQRVRGRMGTWRARGRHLGEPTEQMARPGGGTGTHSGPMGFLGGPWRAAGGPRGGCGGHRVCVGTSGRAPKGAAFDREPASPWQLGEPTGHMARPGGGMGAHSGPMGFLEQLGVTVWLSLSRAWLLEQQV